MNPILKAKRLAKQIAKQQDMPLKSALVQLAQQEGFATWPEYKKNIDDFWYKKSSPFLNSWFASYTEAKAFQVEEGGYLLTYKGQFFVAQADYIEFIGLNPEDPIWPILKYDLTSTNALEKFFKRYGKAS